MRRVKGSNRIEVKALELNGWYRLDLVYHYLSVNPRAKIVPATIVPPTILRIPLTRLRSHYEIH